MVLVALVLFGYDLDSEEIQGFVVDFELLYQIVLVIGEQILHRQWLMVVHFLLLNRFHIDWRMDYCDMCTLSTCI